MPLCSALVSLIKKSWKLHSLPFDKLRPFCSLTAAPATRQRWSFFDDDTEPESSVYKHALKFQRPSTIAYKKFQRVNSVSLIGTIFRELRRINIRDDSLFGLYTSLKVKASPQSNRSFLISLKLWNQMAEISENHLKPNDFVFVEGNLQSYIKADGNGDPRVFYEVNVKEINYVAENSEKPIYYEPTKLDMQVEDYLEKERNRLHLWQEFFANPHEWKDYRRSMVNRYPDFKNMSKVNRHPDFKNMGTGEALWLRHDDPPWVKRQLQLLDSELAGIGVGGRDTTSIPFRSFVGIGHMV